MIWNLAYKRKGIAFSGQDAYWIYNKVLEKWNRQPSPSQLEPYHTSHRASKEVWDKICLNALQMFEIIDVSKIGKIV